MIPEKAIAMLDGQVARHGQTVVLRRLVPNGEPLEAIVRGVVRGYRPEEMTDGITMGTSMVTLSPTTLAGTAFASIGALPRKNDKAVILGRVRNVEAADPVVIDDTIVRINLTVTG